MRLEQVHQSTEAYAAKLPSNHPGRLLFGVLAFRAAGVDPDGIRRAIPSTDIKRIFRDYCDIPGSKEVYFDPFTGRKNDNWPAGSSGTRFQDTAALAKRGKLRVEGSGTVKDYTLSEDYLDVVVNVMLPSDGSKYPLADLVALRNRYSKLTDDTQVSDLVEAVVSELRLTEDEVSSIFAPVDSSIEKEANFFTDDDWSDNRLVPVLGMNYVEMPGEPMVEDSDEWEPPDDEDLLKALRAEMLALHYDVSLEFLANFVTAVRTDRFVVLGGKPGTGKTRFLRKFAEALRKVAAGSLDVRCVMFPVTEETAEWQVVGMRDLDGRYVPSELMVEVSDLSPNGVAFVVLDEMNLAPVDVYGARLLSAVTNGIPFALPGEDPQNLAWYPSNGLWEAPPGLVIVGTVNSPLQEPNRLPLSGPVKRRANVIPMPDRLAEVVRVAERDPDEARALFEALCKLLMAQLRESALDRAVSALDKPVTDRLSQPLSDEIVDLIWAIARATTSDPRLPITLGLVQSILGYVQVAPSPLTELAAVDLQLVQKLIPVLRGHPDVLDLVRNSVTPWQDSLPKTIDALDELRLLAADTGQVTPTW
jgi:MoxR-like ATPase